MIFGWNRQNEEKMEKLQKQVRIMRTALEFYANAKNWEEGHKYRDEDNATIFTDGAESGATVDKGSKAYRALKACDAD